MVQNILSSDPTQHREPSLAAAFINAMSSVILAWGTKMKPKKQPAPELNEQRIDDAVLALLGMNSFYCSTEQSAQAHKEAFNKIISKRSGYLAGCAFIPLGSRGVRQEEGPLGDAYE